MVSCRKRFAITQVLSIIGEKLMFLPATFRSESTSICQQDGCDGMHGRPGDSRGIEPMLGFSLHFWVLEITQLRESAEANTRLQALQLKEIRTHRWNILRCSAMTGENLKEGLAWVVEDAKARLFLY